jgi:hypothetical protein
MDAPSQKMKKKTKKKKTRYGIPALAAPIHSPELHTLQKQRL